VDDSTATPEGGTHPLDGGKVGSANDGGAGNGGHDAGAHDASSHPDTGTHPSDAGHADSGAGPTTTCSQSGPCGSTGVTYQSCTTYDPTLGCTDIDYKTSDGQDFDCGGCTDCTQAAQDLGSYCQSLGQSGFDAGTGTTTYCSTPAACNASGTTYKECTESTGGTCTNAWYELSDGETFQCGSGCNCSQAATDAIQACQSGGSSGGTCNGVACSGTCCNCSGTDVCLTIPQGYSCASYGCQ
jgi:hypothetical protein